MDNPFIYGGAVAGKFFWNREEEMTRLRRDLSDSQKIFLISPRKMGKSSLILTVLKQLKKQNIITVYLDLEKFSTYEKFLEKYLNELVKTEGPIEQTLNFFKQFLPRLRTEIRLEDNGEPYFTFGFKQTSPGSEDADPEIYELPGKISEKKKKKIVIIFDEFQEILKFNGKSIEGVMRSAIQHQRDVGYVFCGSKKHLLADMVNSYERPFYKIGPVMHLERMKDETVFKFLKEKFISSNIGIQDESLKEIIDFARGIPYYAQMVAHESWDRCFSKGRLEDSDVQNALSVCVSQSIVQFQIQWSNLILSKKKLLKSIAVSGGQNIFSKKYMSENNLGYPGAIRKTLLSLMNEEILDKENGIYFFADLLFCRWVKDYVE